MNKYSNGKIYVIKSQKTDKYYIGSTYLSLSKRLYEHRKSKKQYEIKLTKYMSSFKILDYDDHYIELLENYACNSKKELERREGELIKQHKLNIVNMVIAGRTMKEWTQDNKQYLKDYNINRPNKIERNEKKLIKINCECGSIFASSVKARHLKSLKHLNYILSLQPKSES